MAVNGSELASKITSQHVPPYLLLAPETFGWLARRSDMDEITGSLFCDGQPARPPGRPAAQLCGFSKTRDFDRPSLRRLTKHGRPSRPEDLRWLARPLACWRRRLPSSDFKSGRGRKGRGEEKRRTGSAH